MPWVGRAAHCVASEVNSNALRVAGVKGASVAVDWEATFVACSVVTQAARPVSSIWLETVEGLHVPTVVAKSFNPTELALAEEAWPSTS